MILINGQIGDSISVLDRGLAYGDGIFRTLRVRNGTPLLWPWQRACLWRDAVRLGLSAPDEAVLLAEISTVSHAWHEATVKIILTRGVGARGYAPADTAEGTRIVQGAAYLAPPESCMQDGVQIRLCQLRLAAQPALAGIKHLNRLENVLARAEWHDPAIREGLLQDASGALIEGTFSNLFLLHAGTLYTPRLDQCGVAGCVRSWVCEMAQRVGLVVQEAHVNVEMLYAADEVFLCNSLIGLWPVVCLEDRTWLVGSLTRQFQLLYSYST